MNPSLSELVETSLVSGRPGLGNVSIHEAVNAAFLELGRRRAALLPDTIESRLAVLDLNTSRMKSNASIAMVDATPDEAAERLMAAREVPLESRGQVTDIISRQESELKRLRSQNEALKAELFDAKADADDQRSRLGVVLEWAKTEHGVDPASFGEPKRRRSSDGAVVERRATMAKPIILDLLEQASAEARMFQGLPIEHKAEAKLEELTEERRRQFGERAATACLETPMVIIFAHWIEEDGHDGRWEFDALELFNTQERCVQNALEVTEELEEALAPARGHDTLVLARLSSEVEFDGAPVDEIFMLDAVDWIVQDEAVHARLEAEGQTPPYDEDQAPVGLHVKAGAQAKLEELTVDMERVSELRGKLLLAEQRLEERESDLKRVAAERDKAHEWWRESASATDRVREDNSRKDAKINGLAERIKALEEEVKVHVEARNAAAEEGAWMWVGDGSDDLESMSNGMVITMTAAQLHQFATKQQGYMAREYRLSKERSGKMHRRAQRAEGKLARLQAYFAKRRHVLGKRKGWEDVDLPARADLQDMLEKMLDMDHFDALPVSSTRRLAGLIVEARDKHGIEDTDVDGVVSAMSAQLTEAKEERDDARAYQSKLKTIAGQLTQERNNLLLRLEGTAVEALDARIVRTCKLAQVLWPESGEDAVAWVKSAIRQRDQNANADYIVRRAETALSDAGIDGGVLKAIHELADRQAD